MNLLKTMEELSASNVSINLIEAIKTCGTVLREQGVDIYSISKVLGHSSINVTSAIYVHNDVEVLRQALNMKR